MEAYLAPTQPVQVNRISSSCEICSGPHDTQHCMENPEQAFADYASLRTNKVGGTFALLDFESHHEKRLSHLRTQLGQQQDDMIGKINLLWKTISEKLNNVSTPKNTGNFMDPESITAISHDGREELKKKGIKSPSKLLSSKYLSPASINELNKNARRRLIDQRTRTQPRVVKGKEEVKEQGNKENEMETDMEEEEVIEEEESEFETDEEIEEILEEEEDDEDGENFNSFLTIEELTHHEWLLKNPRPPWVKARIRAGSPNNIKISCMVGHFFKRHAYMDLESPINIMSRRQYNQIITYGLRSRQKLSNPN
ncbi:hypothetical protein Tco_0441503 [Tanacetum coccineum]